MKQFNDHIKNILTLRYDPTSQPTIPYKTPEDFKPYVNDPNGYKIEQILTEVLLDELEDVDTIGLALSSGVDSILLAKMIRMLFPKKDMIAYHYCGINDELDDVVKFCKKEKIRLATIEDYSVVKNISSYVDIVREPVWDAFNAPLYSEAKNDGCDVLVTGDGADEILSGYVFRYKQFHPVDTTVESQAWAYLDCHKRDWVDDQANMFHEDMLFNWRRIMGYILRWFDNDLPLMSKVFLADYNGKLVHNFTKRDLRLQDYYGITQVSPYLDWRMTEYCCKLENDNKIMGDVGKWPLRKIANRFKIVPNVKKLGFSHDVVKEWNSSKLPQNILLDERNRIYNKIINRDWVLRHVVQDSSDVRYVNKFLQLIALEYWLMNEE